jgi:hypothetical protein
MIRRAALRFLRTSRRTGNSPSPRTCAALQRRGACLPVSHSLLHYDAAAPVRTFWPCRGRRGSYTLRCSLRLRHARLLCIFGW